MNIKTLLSYSLPCTKVNNGNPPPQSESSVETKKNTCLCYLLQLDKELYNQKNFFFFFLLIGHHCKKKFFFFFFFGNCIPYGQLMSNGSGAFSYGIYATTKLATEQLTASGIALKECLWVS